MNMIDHVILDIPEIPPAWAFYTPVLSELNCDCLVSSDDFVAYGKQKIQFLLMKPNDSQERPVGNVRHCCFVAESREQVDAFYRSALSNGGRCDGHPAVRAVYPFSDVYSAFVRDPFGHSLEAIFSL